MNIWRDHAACATISPDVFVTPGDVDDEPPYPSPAARAICGRCPVVADCLAYALDNRIDYGVWGGMSAYQRRLITRRRSRRECPACYSVDVVAEPPHDFCLACGVSWEIL